MLQTRDPSTFLLSFDIDPNLKIASFRAWLQQHGSASDVAQFSASSIHGVLLLAKQGAVTSHHIEMALTFAEQAGMASAEQAALRHMGELLLRFEASPAQAAESTAVGPLPNQVETTASSTVSTRNLGRAAGLWLLLVVIAGGSAGVWWWTRSQDQVVVAEPLQDNANDPPAGFHLPGGWNAVGSEPIAATGASLHQNALFFRGGSATDPDHVAFVGEVPLTGVLAAGSMLDDEALLAATQLAECGAAEQVGKDYQSDGCTIADVGGRRMGFCAGTILRADRQVAIRTYLQVGVDRGLLALFVAKDSVTGAGDDEATVVAGLQP